MDNTQPPASFSENLCEVSESLQMVNALRYRASADLVSDELNFGTILPKAESVLDRSH